MIDFYENVSFKDIWKSTKDNLGTGIYGIGRTKGESSVKQSALDHFVYIDQKGNLMTWGLLNDMALLELSRFETAICRLYIQ